MLEQVQGRWNPFAAGGIEIAREELERALNQEMASRFTDIFKRLGFKFVTLDLEGFRSGSMNTLLPLDELRRTG